MNHTTSTRKRNLKALPGRPFPLGIEPTPHGLNFALFSETATSVTLILLSDEPTPRVLHEILLPECTDHIWHGVVPDATPGLLYAYRVDGPHRPEDGLRFHPELLLLDPYARNVVARTPIGQGSLRALGVIPTPEEFGEWEHCFRRYESDLRPPLTEMVLYETHVRGISMRHPEVPPEERGTFRGAGSPAVIEHLRALGVRTVEFLPVQFSWPEEHLSKRGLTNYWGYNTISFFAPDPRFGRPGASPAEVRRDFQYMTQAYRRAGIEVILDVVYNHTAEGDETGPTLSFRGIDNFIYYRLEPEDREKYENLSWCGNTLDSRHGRVLQLIADSLRWWVVVMGVDGFRFDLAGALAREEQMGFSRGSGFFDVVLQDPILSRVRLIAEPWDPGPFGYQAGNFPPPWSEWNGEYRDCVRRFWRGDASAVGEFAGRLAGSEDVYRQSGRGVAAGVNFVTCHDGFTLNDLTAYNEKHNESNGENNRDGSPENFSWNCGVEGPTDDPEIKSRRLRQQRNFLLTLFASQGTPLLLGGDELGKTQHGNNNAYCHDNELNWYDWEHADQDLLHFLRRLTELRRSHAVLRRRSFLAGPASETGQPDVYWLHPEGRTMRPADWKDPKVAALGMVLPADGRIDRLDDGSLPASATVLALFHAGSTNLVFRLPSELSGPWAVVLDTATPDGTARTPRDHVALELRGEVELLGNHSLLCVRKDIGA